MCRKIVILFLLAGLLSGCIKEGLGKCETGLRIRFRYTKNNQGEDQLTTQVGGIRIFLFNRASGVLTAIIPVEKQHILRGWIEPDIAEGEYTMVAWATSGGDQAACGYLDAEMTDMARHTFIPQVTVGSTTLDNFRMMLKTEPFAAGSTGEVIPVNGDFDDLFFSIADEVNVSGSNSQTIDFDFTKNTSRLKVRVTGLEHLTRAPAVDQPLCVFVTAPNERYHYNNRIGTYARQVRYEPPYTALTTNAMEVDIKMQRLDMVYHATNPVLLRIQSRDDGQDMIFPLDVVDAILRAEDAHGNPLWRTQEDIGREDEFPFELSILHDLSVRVTINGFEIEDTKPELGR